MAATRTQIYLTAEQRKRLDELGRREGKTLAQVIREAVDAFLKTDKPDVKKAFDALLDPKKLIVVEAGDFKK